ncbi:MAG: hypothetical protein IJL87_04140 [Clostridia bacterium]|nr:hypothetical protein [Clostridia bacterium]
MKKIFCLVLCLITVMLSSCQTAKKSEQPAESSESQVIESQTESETPSEPESDPEEAIYAQLAQLTKEDGTGEISLDMKSQEIVEVLDKYGIKYHDYRADTDDTPGIVCVEDNRYLSNHYDGYGHFSLQQSYMGLKISDKVEKVSELYGEPDEIKKTAWDDIYVYVQKVLYDDPYTCRICFKVGIDEGIVSTICVEAEIPYDEMYG